MDAQELVEAYPTVFHMAHEAAWPGIERHGLLSTSALLDLFEVPRALREGIEASHRAEPVEITHPVHGTAWIRDNKPLSDRRLEGLLEDGTTKEEFYRLLNGHVFFWPTERRLEGLLNARAYKDDSHLVLEVSTADLVGRYQGAIKLSPYNLGSTLYNAPRRGKGTLSFIEDYDFEGWRRRGRTRFTSVAEIAVERAVPEIVEFTVSAELRRPGGERIAMGVSRG